MSTGRLFCDTCRKREKHLFNFGIVLMVIALIILVVDLYVLVKDFAELKQLHEYHENGNYVSELESQIETQKEYIETLEAENWQQFVELDNAHQMIMMYENNEI